MKIKLYIVTYKNDHGLEVCLDSLSKTKIPSNVILETYVINNNTNFYINPAYKNVTVLHNVCRPDFATGHLARNWNQAIINGFKDLNNPDTDILVTCQVDTIFNADWLDFLIKHHLQYSLISASFGDGLVSYTVDAVKKIGLWDERFCTIQYQEADYFLRALIYNKEYSSINDFHHNRLLNPILPDKNDKLFIWRDNNNEEESIIARRYGDYNLSLLRSKYNHLSPYDWSPILLQSPPTIVLKPYITYPYFELDIPDWENKYQSV